MCRVRLRQNLNVLFFQRALTVQMAQKFKSSEPNAGHVTRKIGPLYLETDCSIKMTHSTQRAYSTTMTLSISYTSE